MSGPNFGYSENDLQGRLGDVRLWRRLIDFVLPFWPGVLTAVFLALVVTGSGLALPYLVRLGVDSYLLAGGPATERIVGLLRLSALFALLVGAGFVAGFVQTVVLERSGQGIMHLLRQRLFSHLLSQDLAFFNDRATGRLVTRLTNDIQNMHEMYSSLVVTLFNDLLRLFGILVVLFWMHPGLALCMFLFLPGSAVATVWFSGIARAAFRAIRRSLSRINGFVQESLTGITVIQVLGKEEDNKKKFEALNEAYLADTLHQIRVFASFMPVIECLSVVSTAVILWYGGVLVLAGTMTLGVLVAFLSYMRLFFQPLRELSQKYSLIQAALASAERIFALLDEQPVIVAAPRFRPGPRPAGRIEFAGVSFGYQPGQLALKDISFVLAPGQTLAVVGATGSGKTTLISLLERFYDPQQGRILLDGTDLRVIDPIWLRRHIGMVMQDVFLVPGSIRENIQLGNDSLGEERLGEILAQAQLDAFVRQLADGLDTVVGEGGVEISSGQKQLLAFARVLARDPAIIVLDEATASVDSATEALLEKAVGRTLAGRSAIIIAHRLSTVRRADSILVMDQGRIIESGSHATLMGIDGAYRHLLRSGSAGLCGVDIL